MVGEDHALSVDLGVVGFGGRIGAGGAEVEVLENQSFFLLATYVVLLLLLLFVWREEGLCHGLD